MEKNIIAPIEYVLQIVPNTYEKQGSFADILKEIATLTNYGNKLFEIFESNGCSVKKIFLIF